MIKPQILLPSVASFFGNIGVTSFWMLQIENHAGSDQSSLYISAITGLCAAVVTIFFIYRKEVKERTAANQAQADKTQKIHEDHSKNIQMIYETVVKETNVNISNNNRLTNENIQQTKELREAIQRLPKELREALKDN